MCLLQSQEIEMPWSVFRDGYGLLFEVIKGVKLALVCNSMVGSWIL